MATISSFSKLLFVVICLFVNVGLSYGDFSILGYSPGDLTSTEKLVKLFESWMIEYGKVYENADEKIYRFEIFKDNLKYIDETNKKNNTYWLGLTSFTDLTNDEFKEKYVGSIPENWSIMEESNDKGFVYDDAVNIPESIDWRQKGAVTPVRNQGRCGSCWAFSVVATVEGINQIVTKKLVSLSEQELLDCERRSHGCKGGFKVYALEYVAQNGIHLREKYPYEGVQRQCRAKQVQGPKVKIDGVRRLPPKNEPILIQSIGTQPVSVSLDAKGRAFQNYKGGIFDGPCGTKTNHAVTAVGYGKNYILIKNSWGTEWGERGYLRIKRGSRNSEGTCGVLSNSCFPIKIR